MHTKLPHLCSERRLILIFSLYFSRDIDVFLIHILLWIIIIHNSIPIIQDTLGFSLKARLELILWGIVRIRNQSFCQEPLFRTCWWSLPESEIWEDSTIQATQQLPKSLFVLSAQFLKCNQVPVLQLLSPLEFSKMLALLFIQRWKSVLLPS